LNKKNKKKGGSGCKGPNQGQATDQRKKDVKKKRGDIAAVTCRNHCRKRIDSIKGGEVVEERKGGGGKSKGRGRVRLTTGKTRWGKMEGLYLINTQIFHKSGKC